MRPYKLQYIYTRSHTQALHSESHTSYNTCIFSLIPTPFTRVSLNLIPKSCATVQPHTQAQLQHMFTQTQTFYQSLTQPHTQVLCYSPASYPSLVLQSSLIPKPSYSTCLLRLIPKPCTRVPLSLIPNLVPESQVEMKYASLLDCNGYCHLMFFKK